MSSLLWVPSAWFLAEVNHILASSVIVLICSRQRCIMWQVVAMIAIVALAKEFWMDRTWLEHESLAGSVTDFVAYMVGALGTWWALSYLWWGVGLVGGSILLLTVWDVLHQWFPLTFGE